MLSAFPFLYSWSELAPLLIRLVLGAVFIHRAYREIRSRSTGTADKIIGGLEGLVGILLVIGLWTQIAALVVVIDLVIRLIGRIAKRAFLNDGVNYYILLLAMAISLLLTGAGLLSFDLRL